MIPNVSPSTSASQPAAPPQEPPLYIQTRSGQFVPVSRAQFDAVYTFVHGSGGTFRIDANRITQENILNVAVVADPSQDGIDPDDFIRLRGVRVVSTYLEAAPVLASLGYRVRATAPGIDRFVDDASRVLDVRLYDGTSFALPHGGHFVIEQGLASQDAEHILYVVYDQNGLSRLYDIYRDGAIGVYERSPSDCNNFHLSRTDVTTGVVSSSVFNSLLARVAAHKGTSIVYGTYHGTPR